MTLFAEHLQRRRLAGDARAGRFARGEARRRQYAQARRLWRPLAVFILVCLAAEGGLATRFRADPFLAGLLVGALTTFLFASVYWLIVQTSGTANQMMGDLGEQWTAQELRKLTRRGWRVVNHVSFEFGDVDHVLIGPGGVFAIETKWSAVETDQTYLRGLVGSASERVRGQARSLRLWLRTWGVTDVQPLIVVWGGARRVIPKEVGGVPVLEGNSLKTWGLARPDNVLDRQQVENAWSQLDAYCRKRDAYGDEAEVPPGPGDYLARVVLLMAAGMTTLFCVASLIKPLGIQVWLAAVGLSFVALGLAAKRSSGLLRWALTGAFGSLALMGIWLAWIALAVLT